ncbi:RteC domain-containing protein [Bacteroides sp. OttesenSCG-928-D19]|nr:RteC domain-containing protein [Bacteroides sp. OttesenSCG-928-N06]MDL2304288.1 RteC domain-containing protein [Bacteroides sp. OttesenSCG-928-D19]
MKDNIEKIVNELNASIHVGELELYDIVQNAPAMILMMESAFEELKALVSRYEFPTPEEEITFFKYTKPMLFSKLIYLRKIYYLEIKRPISNFTTIKAYLEKEHEQINGFCNKNVEFIQYYRSGQSCFDEYYFLRGRHEMGLNLESFYFERDPNFSTNFDFKVAKLLANDMLAAYLNCELAKLKYQEENGYQIDGELPLAKWTDKKTALGEIIYGIHEEKSINAGAIEIKALATIFGRIFKVDLSDIYHIFLEIRCRKTNRTEYLNRLVKALNRRMDDADSR